MEKRLTMVGSAMLVLSRQVGERILIGDDIAVTVVRIGPGTVRIGVEAPSCVVIVREEIAGKNSPQPEKGQSPVGTS